MGLCAAVLSPASPFDHPDFPQGTARTIMNVCYAPLLAWGPLVMAVIIDYARRRKAES